MSSEKIKYPLTDINESGLLAVLNDINTRLSALENVATDPTVSNVQSGDTLSVSDREVLTQCAAFFNIHTTVANTVASVDAGVADIDPNTGLPRVRKDVVQTQNVEPAATGV